MPLGAGTTLPPPRPALRPTRQHPPVGARWTLPALSGLVAFALALAQIDRRPLWLDESFTLGATNQLVPTIRATGGTMASYYALVTGWTSVAGDAPVALRLPSAVIMALAVALSVRWVRRILRGPALALAALALATSPALTRYAVEARSYALVTLVTVVAWMVVSRAVAEGEAGREDRARPWWLALALLTVLGETAHGLFVLQLAAMAASVAVLPRRRAHARGLVPSGVALMAMVVLLGAMGAADVTSWIPPPSLAQADEVVHTMLAPGWAALALVVLVAAGTRHLVRWRTPDPVLRWLRLVPVVWGLVPPVLLVVLSAVRPYLIGRYVIASAPALAILAAVGAASLASTLVRPRPGHGRGATHDPRRVGPGAHHGRRPGGPGPGPGAGLGRGRGHGGRAEAPR